MSVGRRSVPDMTTSADDTVDRILLAVAQHHRGDVAGARAAFAALWRDIGPEGDPLHVVTFAHHYADTHDDPAQRQEWDLRALAAADALTDERAQRYAASLQVRGFYPSLHANVADNYVALGDPAAARRHLAAAREHVDALADDAYGALVREYLAKIESRLRHVAA